MPLEVGDSQQLKVRVGKRLVKMLRRTEEHAISGEETFDYRHELSRYYQWSC